jgi:amino-acid N-acetyltransferase
MVSRSFSTSVKTASSKEDQGEYDVVNININPSELNGSSQNNDTYSAETDSAESSMDRSSESKEPLVNVLSIDPEVVDIYERDDEALAESENERQENFLDNPFGNRDFIEMFRGSANYIATHRNSLAVFHIPGDLMDQNPDGFRDLMNDISLTWLLGMRIVIVAGCRYQINKRLGIDEDKEGNEPREEHRGMFVTDHESLRVVKEEAGYVRFEVERQLARALKSRSGNKGSEVGEGNVVSGNFYSAQPFGVLDGVDYKYSGFVRRMETNKIHQVHQNRDIVLLTSLGFSPTGEVFNVNSEYLAAYAAGALGASKVIYFLEKNTALRHKIHGSNIPHLRVNDGRNLLHMNGVRTETKGFVYLDNCPFKYGAEQLFLTKMGWGMNALKAGVKRVHLISPYDGALLQELYTRDGSGTMISGDLYDGIHRATVNDVNAIFDVISPFVKKGTLVERTKAELERDIDQYHVYTRDGLLIACGQLKPYEDGYAEFGCLVVNPLYRAKGRGDAMLGYLERLCVQNGATNLFVLSTQTMEWFVERGFAEVGVDKLPPSRQATYNHQRGSKIYMKKVVSLRDLDANELFWDR